MLLDAYEASGLSGPQFAAQHGVKYQTFATWLQARKRQRGGYPGLPTPESATLVLAEVEGFGVVGQDDIPPWKSRCQAELLKSLAKGTRC